MTNFTELFTTYSNLELLQIIDSPDRYQPLAVETAKTIWESRQLSEVDIQIAQEELANLKQEKEKQIQKRKDIGNKMEHIADTVFSPITMNPTENLGLQKIINFISVVFGVLFLIEVFKKFGMLRFVISEDQTKLDMEMILFFMPLLVVPLATILFFRRKKMGWVLLAGFLTYSVFTTARIFLLVWNMQQTGFSGNSIFPQASPVSYLLVLLFFTGNLVAICTKGIREIFFIRLKEMIMLIVLVALLSVFIN
ncbi:hypothetical protein [Flavobacterium silvaticum]|uniref:Uncharacterized protein n=1 Tax=Flavobacterium silvaticum TaxID=1852020 RepID=A0A972FNF7_9FLAO|nr:hypothetical protein [Flavobacterium silvaticum]NMH29251.1 hypothetical protein [Flavobacterium silvaticum]